MTRSILDLPKHLYNANPTSGTLHFSVGTSLAEIERHVILATLASVDGNKTQAASHIGNHCANPHAKKPEWRRRMDIMIALITMCFAVHLDAPAIVTHTNSPIQIDGQLTEGVWDSAIPITTFKRYMPTDGDSPPAILKYVLCKMRTPSILDSCNGCGLPNPARYHR